MRVLKNHNDVACFVAFRRLQTLHRQLETCYGHIKTLRTEGEEFADLDRHFHELNTEYNSAMKDFLALIDQAIARVAYDLRKPNHDYSSRILPATKILQCSKSTPSGNGPIAPLPNSPTRLGSTFEDLVLSNVKDSWNGSTAE